MAQDQDVPFGVVADLAPVAWVAGARLRAQTDADGDAANAAAEALVTAASAAMAAGHSLTEITQAEARGKEEVRNALRGDTLRAVERTGRRAREMRMEHHQAIARAVLLGLPTREITGTPLTLRMGPCGRSATAWRRPAPTGAWPKRRTLSSPRRSSPARRRSAQASRTGQSRTTGGDGPSWRACPT